MENFVCDLCLLRCFRTGSDSDLRIDIRCSERQEPQNHSEAEGSMEVVARKERQITLSK